MLPKRWAKKPRRRAPGARFTRLLARPLMLEALEGRMLLSVNPIVAENALPGTPQDVWDVGLGSSSIEGFATQMSVDHGQTVQFKISTDSNDYRIDIYRLGYYGGDGARFITTINPNVSLAQNQAAPVEDPATGLIDAGNWRVSASWAVPATAVSGVYIADLIRQDGAGGKSQIVFIVRDDTSTSDIVFKTADATWEAYNDWGGNSLYAGDGIEGSNDGRAYAVSYNRPFDYNLRSYNLVSFVYGTDYPMIRFMEENGYDVTYIATKDLDEQPGLLEDHKIFVTSGHDEYWSAAERDAVETARDHGVSLGFFGGNDMFWKTYFTTSSFDDTTPDRTLVCYKDTHENKINDPNNPDDWTGTWFDPRFSPPADGGLPQNAVTGTLFTNNSDGTSWAVTVPGTDAQDRLWRNTSIASLAPNQTATLSAGTLGEEFDSDVDNGFRPAGEFDLSSTTVKSTAMLLDYGNTFGPGTVTNNMTMYRSSSGALVFSTGSQQWSWGLDADHDGNATVVDPRMQQAVVNLFADMGAQPGTLIAGLVPATMSTDHTAPTSTITSPVSGATLQAGVPITIQGTAQDGGGGVVAGVEVSVDGGATWHPANGRSSWTYSWTPLTSGNTTIMTRAVDDSGNLEQPSAGVTINPPAQGGSAGTIFSVWNGGGAPATVDSGDAQGVELGVKFTSDSSGFITGLRFYKSAANTGTHTGSLWSSSGQLLATATFTSESTSGWQQVNFATPVAVTAGATYVASYHTTSGHYSVSQSYFTSQVSSGPLHILADGGVYLYGTGGFPTTSYQSSNYWVDVVLSLPVSTDITPPTITNIAPLGTSVAINAAVSVAFSEALDPATVNSTTVQLRNGATNAVIPATVSYTSGTTTVTLTPTSSLTNSTLFTVIVQGGTGGVADISDNFLATTNTASFTTPRRPTRHRRR